MHFGTILCRHGPAHYLVLYLVLSTFSRRASVSTTSTVLNTVVRFLQDGNMAFCSFALSLDGGWNLKQCQLLLLIHILTSTVEITCSALYLEGIKPVHDDFNSRSDFD